ncbi:HlyD family type I secretion periplasmic adaptor subunit [Variovorax defluvii]|uniref:Membrane fusion protein (MFP) family protein n=1 Tax=Variovorax defluvii TaxID=913761 RepID=A0ABP8I0D0_9BURK
MTTNDDARGDEPGRSGHSPMRGFASVEAAFIEPRRAAMLKNRARDPGTRAVRLLTWAVAIFVLLVLAWAAMFHIEEITRGQGKLIPAGRVQAVQNQDGGVLSAIHVHEGANVKAGQVLAEFDSKSLEADFAEPRRRWLQGLAAIARIEGELEARPPVFPPPLDEEPQIRADERAGWATNRAEIEATLASFDEAGRQKAEQLERVRKELALRRNEADLLEKELAILRPLVPAVIAETEVLRKERELLNVRSAVVQQEHGLVEQVSAVAQNRADRAKALGDYRARLQRELADRRAEVDINAPKSVARADRVSRSRVVAPIDGVVKMVYFRHPGQVVPPGGVVLDIVPSRDELQIEARILPGDVGFLRKGQQVRVKVSTFDFAVYGALDGQVREISADSVQEKDGKEFYVVQIALQGDLKDKSGKPLPLVPGMQVNVDIVTGSRTVLTYLFKPIVRGLNQSFTER